jgi:hypothetical protein
MAFVKRGKFHYGDSQEDILTLLTKFSVSIGYPANKCVDCVCECGGRVFSLSLDDGMGAAIRTCIACNHSHPIGDSEEYIKDAKLETAACPCGQEQFQITVGLALYRGSEEDVQHIYLGCRCIQCGLTEVFGDWDMEYDDIDELLKVV